MSGDPVVDAENYYCSLERPDRDGTVTFTLVVDIPASGRDENELFENGLKRLNEMMQRVPARDWDWTDSEQYFTEGETA